MEIYTIQRPSLLLAAACAPSAPISMAAPVAVVAAERAPLSQVHQVQIQAELGRTNGSNYGTTGFVGTKRISVTDGGSGVPPRGRPV